MYLEVKHIGYLSAHTDKINTRQKRVKEKEFSLVYDFGSGKCILTGGD